MRTREMEQSCDGEEDGKDGENITEHRRRVDGHRLGD